MQVVEQNALMVALLVLMAVVARVLLVLLVEVCAVGALTHVPLALVVAAAM